VAARSREVAVRPAKQPSPGEGGANASEQIGSRTIGAAAPSGMT